MEANFLHLNILKSKFIHFKSPRQKPLLTNYNIKFNGKELEKLSEIKFLGVKIDEYLTWVPHIKFVTNKLRNSISQLYDMRKAIPKNLKKSAYNAIVNSQFSYAISVWGGSANGNKLKQLFLSSKKSIKKFILYLSCFKTY